MAENTHSSADTSFFSNILTPGSSLHPIFLLIVDCAFLFLFLVLLTLAFLTSGNIHIFALLGIELCLWASVKWFVNELKKVSAVEREQSTEEDKQSETKKMI